MDKKLVHNFFRPFFKNTKGQKGFSLIEVLIAITLFSIFVTAFLTSQGYNITDSIVMKEELTLRNLAEYKMNEVLLNLPDFNEALNNRKDKKDVDLEGFKNYTWEVTFKKLEVPDFSQLMNADTENEQQDQNDNSNANIQKVVMEKLKENIEKIIWQVQVTIRNKDNGDDFSYTVSTWISDPKSRVELNFGI